VFAGHCGKPFLPRGQNILGGISGPWLRIGEGGVAKEMLFTQLVRTLVSGPTENTRFHHFTLKANYIYRMSHNELLLLLDLIA
jgi:hypothetical protein